MIENWKVENGNIEHARQIDKSACAKRSPEMKYARGRLPVIALCFSQTFRWKAASQPLSTFTWPKRLSVLESTEAANTYVSTSYMYISRKILTLMHLPIEL